MIKELEENVNDNKKLFDTKDKEIFDLKIDCQSVKNSIPTQNKKIYELNTKLTTLQSQNSKYLN